MVSILSFFFTKKKPKKAGPPSPVVAPAREPSSDTSVIVQQQQQRARPASRFLSLRHKTTPNPHDATARRSSSELSRRRSQKLAAVGGFGELLPKLDLGYEARASDQGSDGGLGLGSLGRPPVLREKEKKVLRDLRWGLDELRVAWEWFGGAMKSTGLHTGGLMLPRPINTDQTTQLYLIALYALSNDPELISSFPSISAHVAKPISDRPCDVWRDTLLGVLKDVDCPVDIAQALRFILRRLVPSSALLISDQDYKAFVQSEHASSYPLSAYDDLLIPSTSPGAYGYLNEMFELWAAIATRADHNGTSAGKLAYLLGWWAYGSNAENKADWKVMYEVWLETGKRMEHFFYAWVRSQSTKQKLPTRLLQLVDDYPFGQASASSEHLPLPPPSSFPRNTLVVTLGSSNPISDNPTPEEIVNAALSAHVEGCTIPLWLALTKGQSTISGLVAEDSLRFFRDLSHVPIEPMSPTLQLSLISAEGELYRPFSPQGTSPPPEPFQHDENAQGDGSRQVSGSSSVPAWDDFERIGFTEADNARDLGLSFSPTLGKPKYASSPTMHRKTKSGAKSPPSSKKPTFTDKPLQTYAIVSEHVVDIDDIFISFVEEGQLDSVSSIWPPFALVRLASVLPTTHSDKPLEWLLISLEHRPLMAEPSEPEMIGRPKSPSAMSTTSRLGSRGIRDFVSLSSLRRSSSSTGGKNGGASSRRSFFGTSKSRDSDLSDLAESGGETRKLMIGEMGKTIESPTTSQRNTTSEIGTPSQFQTTSQVAPLPIPVERTLPNLGLSGETSSADWAYVAEGGAHIVFSYQGNLSKYRGKVLRIRKPSALAQDHELQRDWRDVQLPKLLPKELLVVCEEVAVGETWLDGLLKKVEDQRPVKQREGEVFGKGQSKGLIMEDLTFAAAAEDTVTLSIEVKPKWGFLPSPPLSPPESEPIKSRVSRFRLHQHYRGHLDTGYDPLDLFSEDEVNVRKALSGLWGLWQESGGKRNNWRVFVDGVEVKPDQANKIPGGSQGGDLAVETASFILPILQSSHALSSLKALQESLDPIDISNLSAKYLCAHPNSELFDPETIDGISTGELEDFVETYLTDTSLGRSPEGWTLRQRMVAYALSAIFKDCSLFIKCILKRNVAGKWELVEKKGNVKVIDLDLKPIKNLKHWADVDEKLWKHWLETKGSGQDGEHAVPVQEELETSAPEQKNISIQAVCVPTPVTPSMASALKSDGVEELPSTHASGSTPKGEDVSVENIQQMSIEENTGTLAESDASVHQNEKDPEVSDDEEEEDIVPRRRNRSLAPSPSPTSVSMSQAAIEGPDYDPVSEDASSHVNDSEEPLEAEVNEHKPSGIVASVISGGMTTVIASGAAAVGAVAAVTHLALGDSGDAEEEKEDVQEIAEPDVPQVACECSRYVKEPVHTSTEGEVIQEHQLEEVHLSPDIVVITAEDTSVSEADVLTPQVDIPAAAEAHEESLTSKEAAPVEAEEVPTMDGEAPPVEKTHESFFSEPAQVATETEGTNEANVEPSDTVQEVVPSTPIEANASEAHSDQGRLAEIDEHKQAVEDLLISDEQSPAVPLAQGGTETCDQIHEDGIPTAVPTESSEQGFVINEPSQGEAMTCIHNELPEEVQSALVDVVEHQKELLDGQAQLEETYTAVTAQEEELNSDLHQLLERKTRNGMPNDVSEAGEEVAEVIQEPLLEEDAEVIQDPVPKDITASFDEDPVSKDIVASFHEPSTEVKELFTADDKEDGTAKPTEEGLVPEHTTTDQDADPGHILAATEAGAVSVETSNPDDIGDVSDTEEAASISPEDHKGPIQQYIESLDQPKEPPVSEQADESGGTAAVEDEVEVQDGSETVPANQEASLLPGPDHPGTALVAETHVRDAPTFETAGDTLPSSEKVLSRHDVGPSAKVEPLDEDESIYLKPSIGGLRDLGMAEATEGTEYITEGMGETTEGTKETTKGTDETNKRTDETTERTEETTEGVISESAPGADGRTPGTLDLDEDVAEVPVPLSPRTVVTSTFQERGTSDASEEHPPQSPLAGTHSKLPGFEDLREDGVTQDKFEAEEHSPLAPEDEARPEQKEEASDCQQAIPLAHGNEDPPSVEEVKELATARKSSPAPSIQDTLPEEHEEQQ